jgi:hypothetical protein
LAGLREAAGVGLGGRLRPRRSLRSTGLFPDETQTHKRKQKRIVQNQITNGRLAIYTFEVLQQIPTNTVISTLNYY